jgi:uroporphyrin-III C-methyltransferase
MKTTAPSLENALPEIAYGSVWLVSAGDGDPHHLSPLAVHALSTADAVIHDPAVAHEILDLVKPPRYCEAAVADRAIQRSIKLAQDGWRVVRLVEGNLLEHTIACAISFAERNIPFRIAPAIDGPLTGNEPIGLLLVRKPLSVGDGETGTLVLLVAAPQSELTTNAPPRQPPLSFSMSGLAG